MSANVVRTKKAAAVMRSIRYGYRRLQIGAGIAIMTVDSVESVSASFS